jgi:hypothetical protein
MSWTETPRLLVLRLFLVGTMRRVTGEIRVTIACAYGTGEHIHASSVSNLAELAISVRIERAINNKVVASYPRNAAARVGVVGQVCPGDYR